MTQNIKLPESRARAIDTGSVRYFNGQPCPAGHLAARYTLSGYCVVCQLIATKAQKVAAKAKRDENPLKSLLGPWGKF